MLVVSNTSPLSNLGVVGLLPLLQQIYPKVIIPPMVYSELMRLSVIQTEITSLIMLGWLEIQPVMDELMDQAGFRISAELYERTLRQVGEL